MLEEAPFVINDGGTGLLKLNQTPTDVGRQEGKYVVNKVTDNVEIKNEKANESILVMDSGPLFKQEPLEQDCTETYHNVYDSSLDVVKHELCSDNPELEHQSDCHAITNFSLKDVTPGHNIKTHIKSEPSQAEVSLLEDCTVTLDTPLAPECARTKFSKIDEASSLKQNCINPRIQQTLIKEETGGDCVMNREDSAQCSSVARGDLCETVIKHDLVTHVGSHTGEPYSCTYCDFKCTTESCLISHLGIHTGEKPFTSNYSTPSLLKVHRTHTREKPFTCNLCDYKCLRKGHLLIHMRTHTGEKPFNCNRCDYKCSRKSSLLLHMRTHTGEKPFTCNYCDYKCSQKCTLLAHMRTHTGEKPFNCNHCTYKCSRKSSLVVHMRTHTGEKPFTCNYCDYRCSQKGMLLAHMR